MNNATFINDVNKRVKIIDIRNDSSSYYAVDKNNRQLGDILKQLSNEVADTEIQAGDFVITWDVVFRFHNVQVNCFYNAVSWVERVSTAVLPFAMSANLIRTVQTSTSSIMAPVQLQLTWTEDLHATYQWTLKDLDGTAIMSTDDKLNGELTFKYRVEHAVE